MTGFDIGIFILREAVAVALVIAIAGWAVVWFVRWVAP